MRNGMNRRTFTITGGCCSCKHHIDGSCIITPKAVVMCDPQDVSYLRHAKLLLVEIFCAFVCFKKSNFSNVFSEGKLRTYLEFILPLSPHKYAKGAAVLIIKIVPCIISMCMYTKYPYVIECI